MVVIIRLHLADFFINSLTDLLIHCVTSLCWDVFAHLNNWIGDYGDYGDGGDGDGDGGDGDGDGGDDDGDD